VENHAPATVPRSAKVETFNPGNSIKDRMAVKMIEDAEKKGPAEARRHHHRRHQRQHRHGPRDRRHRQGLQVHLHHHRQAVEGEGRRPAAFGAEVIVCPTNVDPEDPRSVLLGLLAPRARNAELVEGQPVRQPLELAKAHYESTGPEIWEQTEGKIDHLVVGVGTGGTICGTGKYLKEKNPSIKCWGIDTYGSVFKKYKETGIFDKHEIYPYVTEGIGEDFLPKNVDFSVIDHFEKVTDRDAAIYTRRS
jgi:cystathionine beta-synthase